jgi:hypothetical protein
MVDPAIPCVETEEEEAATEQEKEENAPIGELELREEDPSAETGTGNVVVDETLKLLGESIVGKRPGYALDRRVYGVYEVVWCNGGIYGSVAFKWSWYIHSFYIIQCSFPFSDSIQQSIHRFFYTHFPLITIYRPSYSSPN